MGGDNDDEPNAFAQKRYQTLWKSAGALVISQRNQHMDLRLLTNENEKQSDNRIIGGEVVEDEDRPHFMAIFNFKPSATVKCFWSHQTMNI